MMQTGDFNSYQFNVCQWDGRPAVVYFPTWKPAIIATFNRYRLNVRKYDMPPSGPPEPTQDPRFLFFPLPRVISYNPPTRVFILDPLPRKFTDNSPSRLFTYNPLPKVTKHVV